MSGKFWFRNFGFVLTKTIENEVKEQKGEFSVL